MEKKIRLTEGQLYNLVKESVNRMLNEGSVDSNDIKKWDFLKKKFGADGFIDEIFNVLDGGTIHGVIKYIFKMHDLGDDSEDYDDEDYEYVQDFHNLAK